MSTSDDSFKPALLIVDFQEDFCPPGGAIPVPGGRDIAPVVNNLLSLPFTTTVATKDFHPRDHVSFATNHPPPNNIPLLSEATIANPYNPEETVKTLLWPVHCVQGTKGSELVPELDTAKVQHIIEKGQDKRVEMYSAFAAPFSNPVVSRSGLANTLKEAGTTHVYVVGLAEDFCVKFTAIDSAKEGFTTYVVQDGTRLAMESNLPQVKSEFEKVGVKIVDMEGEEVARVRSLAS